MANEEEIKLKKELYCKDQQILRLQSQFRDVSLQYHKAKRKWEFAYCVQLVIIIVLAGINIFELNC